MVQNNPGRESVGASPVGPPAKKRGVAAWLIPLILAIIAVIILLLLLSRCGGSSDGTSSAAATSTPGSTASTTASADASATAAADATASPSISSGTPADSGDGEDGTITAGGATVLPLTGSATSSLSASSGDSATATAVEVESVPSDEGFWVGSGTDDRVWVQLTGKEGESPFKVEAGEHVSFTGTVTENESGFAGKIGLTSSEGQEQLEAQGSHIFVQRSSLKLAS